MINIEEIETEAAQARDAINAILGHFTVRTGFILDLSPEIYSVDGEPVGLRVEARVVLGVK